MIMAAKNANVSWLLNFGLRMFLKSAVRENLKSYDILKN